MGAEEEELLRGEQGVVVVVAAVAVCVVWCRRERGLRL